MVYFLKIIVIHNFGIESQIFVKSDKKILTLYSKLRQLGLANQIGPSDSKSDKIEPQKSVRFEIRHQSWILIKGCCQNPIKFV